MTGEWSSPGTIVDGTYEIVALIGEGGMSRVWLGRDVRLDKLWAIKEIVADASAGAQEAALRQAALAEAQFMKRLDHPAIPRVVDICEEGKSLFVVMDFVNGRSLGRMLRERKEPFAQDEVIGWARTLCDVLDYLHTRSPAVIYRDLKPDNIMLREDGSLRLVDFGIATEWHEGMAPEEHVLATPGYAAPEQLERDRVCDLRADIYALGVTMYSLVCGHVPRPLGDGGVDFDMRPLRLWNPQLSEGLEHIVIRATDPDPDKRYQSVVELRYDLEHHEALTQEYRAKLQRRVRAFQHRIALACATGLVAVGCVACSAALHETTYDELMRAASVASEQEIGASGVSAIEQAYEEVIACDPSRIAAYQRLLAAYKTDLVFTATEASQLSKLFVAHGRALEGDSAYAKLCFDVGVLYLCYYEAPSAQEATLSPAGARRSAEWFERARAAADAGCDLDEATYRSAGAYLVIAQFHDRVSQATYEGAGGSEVYRELWGALRDTAASLSAADEAAVRLRLYQVAFESLASPTYLRGFWRAGVARQDAEHLLATVSSKTRTLVADALENEVVLGAIYREIVDGADNVRKNIAATYENPVAIEMTKE